MGNHGGGAFPQKRIVMVQQYGHNSSFLQRARMSILAHVLYLRKVCQMSHGYAVSFLIADC